jgi:hypothetical protein
LDGGREPIAAVRINAQRARAWARNNNKINDVVGGLLAWSKRLLLWTGGVIIDKADVKRPARVVSIRRLDWPSFEALTTTCPFLDRVMVEVLELHGR